MADSVIIIFLLICLKSIKYCPNNENYDDYLSKTSILPLRGIFSIIIILYHESQHFYNIPILYNLFKNYGSLAITFFFFVSGYGLISSWIEKVDYDKNFLFNRAISILPIYAISMMIYWIANYFVGNVITFKSVLLSLINGNPVVTYSWFIIVITIAYIIFYFQMKIFKRNYGAIILSTIINCFLWACIRKFIGYGDWWSSYTFSFPFGMLWYVHKEKTQSFFVKHYWLLLLFCLIFIATIYLIVPNDIISLLNKRHIMNVFVPTIIMIFSMKLKMISNLLNYLGKISMELYLFHGIFVDIILNNKYIITLYNGTAYAFLCIVLSIAFASVIHIINNKIACLKKTN